MSHGLEDDATLARMLQDYENRHMLGKAFIASEIVF